MDPELKKGFQELQTQVLESRSKISNIETCQKLTTHDAKINDSILEEFSKDENIDDKFFYQPVGRMLIKQEGKKALEFLIGRQKEYQERLKQYKEVKDICLARVKESENSLRELVNKKLNKSDQLSAPIATSNTTTKEQVSKTDDMTPTTTAEESKNSSSNKEAPEKSNENKN